MRLFSLYSAVAVAVLFLSFPAFSQEVTEAVSEGSGVSVTLQTVSEDLLAPVVEAMSSILFFAIPVPFMEGKSIPFLILWLMGGGVFFTLKLGFVNIRLFGHALNVVRGKYANGNEPGEVTHAQALCAAVSGTVGLGNIAGVAIAVSMGGPGAVLWMMLAGLLGMSTKFAEVTLGHKYRHIDEDGKVSGGAFHYLEDGLRDKGLPRLGKVLAVIFAIFCIGGAIGGGNMFQANQSIAIIADGNGLSSMKWLLALVLAISIGTVLIGGIKRIAVVAQAIVPLMAIVYIASCLTILAVHIDQLGEMFILMFKDAVSGEAVGGGIVGAIVAGFRRAAFSNEAGMGSAPIAHAAAKTREPVQEGCVALLEPFLDTVVICFLTGMVITITGAYHNSGVNDGILLTRAAFLTVADWFPILLSVAAVLFAFSTMITWSYYGERAWQYLFGGKRVVIFHVIFVIFTFIGGITTLGVVVDFSDMLFLSMALPNLVGLYLLSDTLCRDVKEYNRKRKAGELKVYK